MKFNEADRAYKYITYGIKTARENNYFEDEIRLIGVLSDYYLKKKQYKGAYDNYVLLHNLQDSIYNKKLRNRIEHLRSEYELEKSELENNLIKTLNELSKSNIKAKKQTKK